ncbi:hypothetical protein [Bradyrhizobium sp. RDI18]|uniref:hypothetical protein n=1 Tax=Bradyrhizobium sp. RDI18 TaxID=3367400 RepID=UPI00372151C3
MMQVIDDSVLICVNLFGVSTRTRCAPSPALAIVDAAWGKFVGRTEETIGIAMLSFDHFFGPAPRRSSGHVDDLFDFAQCGV